MVNYALLWVYNAADEIASFFFNNWNHVLLVYDVVCHFFFFFCGGSQSYWCTINLPVTWLWLLIWWDSLIDHFQCLMAHMTGKLETRSYFQLTLYVDSCMVAKGSSFHQTLKWVILQLSTMSKKNRPHSKQ